MQWRAPDKVTAWRQIRRQMEVIFVADQVAVDRQWALILVAGGNEAYNCLDTLEGTVQNKEEVEQVWQAFEKKVCITGFLALQFTVKWLKAPTLRVSPARGCTQTQTQTMGLK